MGSPRCNGKAGLKSSVASRGWCSTPLTRWNRPGCLTDTLSELFGAERLFLVLGMAMDKKVEDVVAILAPLAHEVIVTAFHSPRACKPQRLADEVRRHGVAVRLAETPEQALALARAQARTMDAICVTGSVLLLGEIKAHLLNQSLEFSG